jgi:hypothetical protein
MSKKCFSVLSLTIAGAVAASILLTPAGSLAQQRAGGRTGGTGAAKTGKTAPEVFAVVQIGDEIKVIRNADILTETKKVTEDYKRDMKKWQEDKKSDPKAEKPKKLTLKVLKRSIKTKEEADEFCTKMQDKQGGGASGAPGTEKKTPPTGTRRNAAPLGAGR